MKKIFPKVKVKEIKEILEIVEKTEYTLTQEEINKILIFSKVLSDNGQHLIFTKLFDKDENIALGLVNKMLDFALKEKIPTNGIFEWLVALEIATVKSLYQLFINPKVENLKLPKDTMEPDESELRIELYSQLEKVFDYGNAKPHFGKIINPAAFQEILNNSYDEIKKQVHISIKNTDLPLSEYFIDGDIVTDEVETEQRNFDEIFTNPRSLSKIESDNHFFSYLLKDDLEITDEYKVIFRGHTKALSIGYTDKAILLSLDKNITIRELNTNLKHLEKYNTDESKELIAYTKKLIEFINQKRNANIIPFKALAKELGITKNQAKNYAKRLLSINDKTFTNKFENIKLLDK